MQRGEGISAFMYVNGRTDREAERERGTEVDCLSYRIA